MASPGNSSFRLSMPVYFACVGLLTVLGFGAAMTFRPSLYYLARSALGLDEPPQATSNSFYAVRVAPLFEEHCASCHGARRQKADLRLDSFARTMRGGKHGPIIVRGETEGSELMRRLTLPRENDRTMPPPGQPPLAADEVKVVKLWIAAGASGVLPVAAIKDAPTPAMRIDFPEIDEAVVRQVRAPLAPAFKQLQARFPSVLAYESRDSANLQLNASLLGREFGDREFAALALLYERIVWVDLSSTAISDASAQNLAKCVRLKVLRLANTRMTATTAHALASLKVLKSLTVVKTDFPASALAVLHDQGVRIYGDHAPFLAADTSS